MQLFAQNQKLEIVITSNSCVTRKKRSRYLTHNTYLKTILTILLRVMEINAIRIRHVMKTYVQNAASVQRKQMMNITHHFIFTPSYRNALGGTIVMLRHNIWKGVIRVAFSVKFHTVVCQVWIFPLHMTDLDLKRIVIIIDDATCLFLLLLLLLSWCFTALLILFKVISSAVSLAIHTIPGQAS